MRRVTTVLAMVSVLLMVACSGEDNGGDNPVDETSAMSGVAPDGELLCDFVPRESAVLALGADDVTADDGQVARDSQGALVGAGCGVTVGDDDENKVSVLVDYMLGAARGGFEDGINDPERYNQLPDDVGLGYSSTDESRGADARLSRGDYLIEVRVSGGAEGRDHEADAVALAQQVAQTLEIPDEWTLPETPPSR